MAGAAGGEGKDSQKPVQPTQSIEEQAQEVLRDASAVLAKVDASYVFSILKQKCRDFPTFEGDEIDGGTHLGRGGFSNVFEVTSIQLKKEGAPTAGTVDVDPGGIPKAALTGPQTTVGGPHNQHDDEDHHHQQNNTHVHYEILKAREIMSKQYMRMGQSRYAIKCLRSDLDKLGYARGALDLAIEIKFLSVLWHPNIIKMRAYSETSTRVSTETFIVMGE
jgi:hypothetical protein